VPAIIVIAAGRPRGLSSSSSSNRAVEVPLIAERQVSLAAKFSSAVAPAICVSQQRVVARCKPFAAAFFSLDSAGRQWRLLLPRPTATY